MGDFNFLPEDLKIVTEQLQAWNFTQLIKFATHKDGGTIDHAYVSELLTDSADADAHYVYYSDHQGLLINLTEK